MRALILAAALLAAPVAAQAASPKVIDEFMAICVSNQNQPAATIAAAKARGFVEVPVTKREGTDTLVGLVKEVDGNRWATVVATYAFKEPGADLGQDMSSCSITGNDIGTSSADAARRWAGMPAGAMGQAKSEFYFYERAGKRTPLAQGDEAATVVALKSGGYALLQIETTEGVSSLTLTNAKPLY